MFGKIDIRAHGAVKTKVRILEMIGDTRILLWTDTDGDGSPDKKIKVVKESGDKEDVLFDVGPPEELDKRVLQWIWIISRPIDGVSGDFLQQTEHWDVEIVVQQDEQDIFKERISGKFGEDESVVALHFSRQLRVV